MAHVFRLKVQKLLEMLKSEMVFGKAQAWLYSIEWQKHGLPHCHLLLWLSADHRITPDKIDNVICGVHYSTERTGPNSHTILRNGTDNIL